MVEENVGGEKVVVCYEEGVVVGIVGGDKRMASVEEEVVGPIVAVQNMAL